MSLGMEEPHDGQGLERRTHQHGSSIGSSVQQRYLPPQTLEHDAGSNGHSASATTKGLCSADDVPVRKTLLARLLRWLDCYKGRSYEALSAQLPEHALLLLSKQHPLRRAAILVIKNRYWDQFILAIIIANCVTLALSSHAPGFDGSPLGQALITIDYYFLAVFAAEMALKLVAMGGFMVPGTYFRDGWNMLDAAVVVLGFIQLGNFGNYTAIRAVRVLRPLRTITRVEGMRVLVVTLIKSLPMLVDVMLLCFFAFFVLGIVAINTFAGALNNRCAIPDFTYSVVDNSTGAYLYSNVTYHTPPDLNAQMCSGYMAGDVSWLQDPDNASNIVMQGGTPGEGYTCPMDPDLENGAPFGYVCAPYYPDPNYGFNYGMTSFDNIIWAFLTIFQCTTEEGWTDIMYAYQDAISPWVWVYFFVMMVFCSFFIVNLALAVLYIQFVKQDPAATDTEEEAAGPDAVSKFEGQSTDADKHGSIDAPKHRGSSDGEGMDEEGDMDWDSGEGAAVHVVAVQGPVMASKGGEQQQQHLQHHQQQKQQGQSAAGSAQEWQQAAPQHDGCWTSIKRCWCAFRRSCLRLVEAPAFQWFNVAVILANTAVMAAVWYPLPAVWDYWNNYVNYGFTVYFAVEMVMKLIGLGIRGYFADHMNQFDGVVVAASIVEMVIVLTPGIPASSTGSLSVMRTFRLLRVFKLARSWKQLNRLINTILRSVAAVSYLSLLLLLYLFVFALLGMQLFGYKLIFCDNTTEGAVSLCPPGLDPVADCPPHPDCYVQCQASDVLTWINAPGSPYNDMAYCEAFPRSNATSTDSVEYWAQVGKAEVPRSRFDSIGWAMLTVFQLLTTENWNNVLYSGMLAVSPWAAFYFIIAIVLGTYIIFNLFLAILLDNFSGSNSADGEPEENSSQQTSKDAAVGPQQVPVLQQVLAQLQRLVPWQTGSNRIAASTSFNGRSSTAAQELLAAHLAKASEASVGRASRQCTLQGAAGALQIDAHRQGLGLSPMQQPPSPAAASPGAGTTPLRTPGGVLLSHSLSAASRSPNGTTTSYPANSAWAEPYTRQEPHSSFTLGAYQPSAMLVNTEAVPGPSPLAVSAPRGRRMSALGLGLVQLTAAEAGGSREVPGMDGAVKHADANGEGQQDEQSQDSANEQEQAPVLTGTSLWLMGPDHWLRNLLSHLTRHKAFENSILFVIVVSSITLAMDSPGLDPESPLKQALVVMDLIFVVIFAVEAALKIAVHGFVLNGATSYLRNYWNMLDFVIAVIGVAMQIVATQHVDPRHLAGLRGLRTLRALRPLRAASRLQSMRIVVNALFAAIPSLGNVMVITVLFFAIFAIVGINLLSGFLYSCQDSHSNTLDPDYYMAPGQTMDKSWCLAGTQTIHTSTYHAALNVSIPAYNVTTHWVGQLNSFDNLYVGFWTLFCAASTEGWMDLTYAAVDAVGIDQQPITNHNPGIAVFFVVFMVIGAFFILNLFITVTIDKFAELQQQSGHNALLTPQQAQWLSIQKMMAHTAPAPRHQPPANALRRLVFDVAMNDTFDAIIMGCIIMNIIIMAMTHFNMNDAWQNFMSYSNLAFTIVFTLECLLKATAMGPRAYCKETWHQFDVAIVAVSIAGVVVDLATTATLSFLPLLRVLRVLRIFRLIPKAKGLRSLLQTLLFSLPALANVGSVLFLFFFVYAVIGMNLFGMIKEGNCIGRHANFSNMGMALLTLLRMVTGENWPCLQQDCMVTEECIQVTQDVLLPDNTTVLEGSYFSSDDPILYLVPDRLELDRCSPSPIAAIIYFCTFVTVCGMIIIDFVVGVIIDNMASAFECEELPVSKSHLEHFAHVWSELDPAATNYIPAVALSPLISELDPPLGVRGEEDVASNVQRIIMSVDIPMRPGNKVHFLETLHALAGRVAGTDVPEDEEKKVHAHMTGRLPSDKDTLKATLNATAPGAPAPGDPSAHGGTAAAGREASHSTLGRLMSLSGRQLVAGAAAAAEAASFPKYTVAHFYAALYVQAAIRGFLQRHALKRDSSRFREVERLQQLRALAAESWAGSSHGQHSGGVAMWQQEGVEEQQGWQHGERVGQEGAGQQRADREAQEQQEQRQQQQQQQQQQQRQQRQQACDGPGDGVQLSMVSQLPQAQWPVLGSEQQAAVIEQAPVTVSNAVYGGLAALRDRALLLQEQNSAAAAQTPADTGSLR